MPVRGSFEIKGLDAYLETLVNAEKDIDQVVADVLTEAAPIAEGELLDRLLKTKQSGEVWEGDLEDSIGTSAVQRDGNYTFFELSAGVADGRHIYKEFGNTRQAAEPFFRPAFRRLRQYQIKKMLKSVLDKFGLKP